MVVLGSPLRFLPRHRLVPRALAPHQPSHDRAHHGLRAGVLISAVAVRSGRGSGRHVFRERTRRSLGLFAGCLRLLRWRLVDLSPRRRRPQGCHTATRPTVLPLAIVLGTVLDGIPESMVIGLTIFQGGAVGAAYLSAVFISNLPESISSTSGLLTWWLEAVPSPLDVGLDRGGLRPRLPGRYGLFQTPLPPPSRFVLAFAAGAILTMLANTMMPEAFEHGGKLVGRRHHPRLRGRLHHSHARPTAARQSQDPTLTSL